MRILRRHAFSAWTGGSGLSSSQFCPSRKRLLDMGVLGRGKAAPAALRTEGAGVGSLSTAGELGRCAEPEGAARRPPPGSPGCHGRAGGRSPRRLFCLGKRPLVTVPGCHFVAWPPFRAAEGGRATGEGRRPRPGSPPRAHRRARPLCSSPPGWTAARPRGALVGPRKSRREACARPPSPPSSEPSRSGICPPHPGCVKGIHFMGEGSELNRGKLECHPEKEGALRSPALAEVAQPFVSSALSHDGALHRSH